MNFEQHGLTMNSARICISPAGLHFEVMGDGGGGMGDALCVTVCMHVITVY